MKKGYKLIFWVAAIVLLYFMNGSLLITDSVESNYSLTAKEMVLSGNWISPQIYGVYWFDKPIMSYWLIATGFKLFGFNEFGARFFPSLSGLCGLWLTVWFGKKIFSEKIGYLGGAILLTSLQFFTISKSVLTDGMLFFFFNGALACFYLGYSTENKNYYYGTYAGAALATLTKGPIGFLLPGLIITLFLVLERNWRELGKAKLLTGTILFCLIAGPWYGTMFHLHPDFYGKFFGTHNFLRATQSEHPRDNVIWYYTAINILASYAWIGFFPATVKNIIYKAGQWVMPAIREKFLLLWTFTIFFFYQNMATKYITYTYPILLPLSLLIANYIVNKGEELQMKAGMALQLIIYILLTATAIYLPQYDPTALQFDPRLVILFGSCSIMVLWAGWKRRGGASVGKTVSMMILAAFVMNLCAVKLLAEPLMFNSSGHEVAQYFKKNFGPETTIFAYNTYPTSAVFYSGHEIKSLVNDQDVAKFDPKGFSWSAKNVMPYDTIGNLPKYNKLAVVVEQKAVKDIKKIFQGQNLVEHKMKGRWVVFTLDK